MKLHRFYTLSLIVFAMQCHQPNKNVAASFSDGPPQDEDYAIATLAGGCFWCTEAIFEQLEGVYSVVSGYAGGHTDDPTYDKIGSGRTGHAEAIQIYYDTSTIDFPTLLEVFFYAAHDPTQVNRQGPDVGTQYRSIAFYQNETEKKLIATYIERLDKSGHWDQPIATQIKFLEKFYVAEDYHQNYYPAHPDNPYIQNVTRPKVEKFEKQFKHLLKKSP